MMVSEANRDNSNWMARLPEEVLRDVPLCELSIPGSHDSFTYNLTRDGKAGADQPAWLRRLTRLLPGLFSHVLYRWSITQDLSPSQQLDAGIRYFDIRLVALKGSFRVLHCLTGDLISEVLHTLNSWLEAHQGEVIILDFQHLYQFTEADHHHLVRMVLTQFYGKLCSWTEDLRLLTLHHLTSRGVQVVVIYPAAGGSQPFLWPRSLCPSPWPNTMRVSDLLDNLTNHLAQHHKRQRPSLFVSQGVLTPSWRTVSCHPLSSVKSQCADRCRLPVLRWLEQESLRNNILIMDFVLPDNINHIIDKNL